jgi:hypothetical protein
MPVLIAIAVSVPEKFVPCPTKEVFTGAEKGAVIVIHVAT